MSDFVFNSNPVQLEVPINGVGRGMAALRSHHDLVSCVTVRSRQPPGHPHVCACAGTVHLHTCMAINFPKDEFVNTSIDFSVLLQRKVKANTDRDFFLLILGYFYLSLQRWKELLLTCRRERACLHSCSQALF